MILSVFFLLLVFVLPQQYGSAGGSNLSGASRNDFGCSPGERIKGSKLTEGRSQADASGWNHNGKY